MLSAQLRTKSELCITSGSSEIRNKRAGKGTNVDIIQWLPVRRGFGHLAAMRKTSELPGRFHMGCDERLCFSKVSSPSFQSAYDLEMHRLIKAIKN